MNTTIRDKYPEWYYCAYKTSRGSGFRPGVRTLDGLCRVSRFAMEWAHHPASKNHRHKPHRKNKSAFFLGRQPTTRYLGGDLVGREGDKCRKQRKVFSPRNFSTVHPELPQFTRINASTAIMSRWMGKSNNSCDGNNVYLLLLFQA